MVDNQPRRILSGSRAWPASLEPEMLYEDVTTGIVPFRSGANAYSLDAGGYSPYKIEECLSLDGRGGSLDGFFRQVATSLLTRSEMWLEVYIKDEDQEAPTLQGVRNRLRET